MSHLDEYILIRSLVGITIITSVTYTGITFSLLGKYLKAGRENIFIQTFGGILVALGFSAIGISDDIVSIFLGLLAYY